MSVVLPIRKRPTNKAWIPQHKWDEVKTILHRLYMVEQKPLPEVMIILQAEHKFKASPRMYKAQFRRWNWQKYHRRKFLVPTKRGLPQLEWGKPTIRSIGESDHTSTNEDMGYCLRRAITNQPEALRGFLRVSVSPRPQSSLSLPHTLGLPQELFRITQNHIERSFETGLWASNAAGEIVSTAKDQKSTWRIKAVAALDRAFTEHLRHRPAVGHLAKACAHLENAQKEDDPLLTSTLIVVIHQWTNGVFHDLLPLRHAFLRCLHGWACVSDQPSARYLQTWSRLLLLTDNLEVYQKLIAVEADVFTRKGTQDHPVGFLLRHRSLWILRDEVNLGSLESIFRHALQANSPEGLRMGNTLSDRWLRRGQYEQVDNMPVPISDILRSPGTGGGPALWWATNLVEAQIKLGRLVKANRTCTRIVEWLMVADAGLLGTRSVDAVEHLNGLLGQLDRTEDMARLQGFIDKVNQSMEEEALAAIAEVESENAIVEVNETPS